MKKITVFSIITVCLIAAAVLLEADYTAASSHCEAPIISTDPLADNTDVYTFVHTSDATKHPSSAYSDLPIETVSEAYLDLPIGD